jgi:DNA repair exonuclease SbcCD ATPase subunit
MISNLSLRNWRNYNDVTIQVGAGTTFVVASNGVGKTSLVEAARFAIFGAIHDPASAITLGCDVASATAVIALPSQRVLTIERTIERNKRGAVKILDPTATMDGKQVSASDVRGILAAEYGAELEFLCRLTMPAITRDQENPSALGLQGHLERFYGIDGLRNAIEELNARKKSVATEIRKIKAVNSVTSSRLEALRLEVERATADAAASAATHADLQGQYAEASDHARVLRAVDEWVEQERLRQEGVSAIATSIGTELSIHVSGADLIAELDQEIQRIDEQLSTWRVARAVNQNNQQTLRLNQERLDSAHDNCPVCRRPLDDGVILVAHGAYDEEMSALRQADRELADEDVRLGSRRDAVVNHRNRATALPRSGPRPQFDPAIKPISRDELENLDTRVQSALDDRVAAEAARIQAVRELTDAQQADVAMRQLESLHRQEASIQVAVEATEATLGELLAETIRPLESQVNQRWSQLFPGRGELSTDASGTISRALDESTQSTLPFEAFSTGEGMGAVLLLRVLVATMATNADFCWFDEPLEHLDPDVRRQVANLLARATDGQGPLQQILVTTYEEPLVRQLAARESANVSLVDVRQSP